MFFLMKEKLGSILKSCGKQKLITAQKMKFSIKDFFSKFDQIRSFLWIWSHSLKKSLMENFVFCAVNLKSYIEFERN